MVRKDRESLGKSQIKLKCFPLEVYVFATSDTNYCPRPVSRLPFSPPLQIAFAQVRAQEKAEQAASHMTAHLETEGEEHTPNPAPLTSPSYQVVAWVTNSVCRGTSRRVNRSARKVVLYCVT